MKQHPSPLGESGQAIVLLALVMIILLGFAGLAIDGGNLYAQRRHAQAAVDNAALAYGLTLSRQASLTTCPGCAGEYGTTAETRAEDVLESNGYVDTEDPLATNVAVLNPNDVDIVIGTPASNTIAITLTKRVPTAFIHLVYQGFSMFTVTAKAKGSPAVSPFAGYGIVSLKQCTSSSANGSDVGVTGGGNSGGINVYNGGILTNLPIPAGNSCPFNPPKNGTGITATEGICNVGSETEFGGNMSDVTPNCNGGEALVDPMSPLNSAPPTCSGDGSINTGTNPYQYSPGNYDDDSGTSAPKPGWGTYAPGIYCFNVDDAFKPNDPNSAAYDKKITGSGIVFYFESGSFDFSGQGDFQLTGPNCTTRLDDTTEACAFPHLVVYSKPGDTASFGFGGNGSSFLTGTIYLPDASFDMNGGGSGNQDLIVTGQIIAYQVSNNGNGSLRLIYDETQFYTLPATMQLVE